MLNKKGFQMAFGMIFSIILIVVILAVAIFVINHFLNLNDCAEVSLFYNNFQDKVDNIWNSDFADDTFSERLPGGIDKVCIGLLDEASGTSEFLDLRTYRNREANIFLLPTERACDIPFAKIAHIEEAGFECFTGDQNDVVRIPLSKTSFDPLVKVG